MSNSEFDANKNDSSKPDVIDTSCDKAIETYKKIYDKEDMSDKAREELEKACKIIEARKVITESSDNEPKEIKNSVDAISGDKPTLTRFEKARIMGSRALQLSLGAPPFIDFSENISTSLEIAMEELQQKVIPIVIRRTLPNGDYQNIPIDQFQ